MKNRFLLIFIAVMLLLPVQIQAEDDIAVSDVQQTTEEQVAENPDTENITVQNLDEDTQINEDNNSVTQTPYTYKQPISKRKLLKKLILAMLGVGLSSLAIYVMLTLYNRFRDGYIGKTKTPEGNVSLDLPDNLNGAVKTFLEKTKWN